MAHFRPFPGSDTPGFDADRSLLVVPLGTTARLCLVAGADLDVATDDTAIATGTSDTADSQTAHRGAGLTDWERSQNLRRVNIRGVAPGQTQLHARLNGADWSWPLTVSVVTNQDARRVGTTAAAVSADIRRQIQGVDLRTAVLMVAEDQMNSAISRTNGFGRYDVDPSYNWCGAFAHWCWKMAAAIKGVDSPFGTSNDKLLSPQKAISWAMQDTTPGILLRYEGSDPFRGGRHRQEYIEIGCEGYNLLPADIVLLRSGSAGGWRHVCMVYSYDGSQLLTMDGNQGAPRCIKEVRRDMTATVGAGDDYALVFVHVLGV